MNLALLVALVLTVFEGAIRKWILRSEAGPWSYLAYFSKDLAFAAILLWPGLGSRSRALEVFKNWLIPGSVLFIAGATLSSLYGLNPVGSLLTLRAGLVLPMLALLAASRLKGLRVDQLATLVIICALTNCVLSFTQTHLPPDHLLNRYVLSDSPVIALETAVRATGTFSYITGLATLSIVAVWAGMVSLALSKTRVSQLMSLCGILGGFGCALASVSRGPVVMGALMLATWAGFSRAGFAALSRGAVIWIPALFLICGLGLVPRFNQLGRVLIERHQASDDSFGQRAFGQLAEACAAAAIAPFGAGLGTEQVAGNYAVSGEMSFTNYETQFPRLITETGIMGLFGYLAICTGAALALQQARRSAPTDAQDAILFATQLLLVPLFYGNVLFNHTASAFVWMIFSAVMAGAGSADEAQRDRARTDNDEAGNTVTSRRRLHGSRRLVGVHRARTHPGS